MRPHLALVVSVVLWSGCQQTSELGKPCVLVRKSTPEELAADGVRSRPLLESDIPEPRPGEPRQDFISFGSTDCEDLICVRDAHYVSTAPDTEPARGYCSKPCVQGVQDTCAMSPEGEAPAGLRERMGCRALLLDQQQLEKLRAEDPATYRQTFGDNTSPYFCAGGAPSDTAS